MELPEELLEWKEVEIEIDGMMLSYFNEVQPRRKNKCRRSLSDLIADLRGAFLLITPFTHKKAPHINQRKLALENVARCARELNAAIRGVTNDIYIQDYISLQVKLEEIQPPEGKFGFPFSRLLGYSDYESPINPLHEVEVGGLPQARFSHRRTGVFNFLDKLDQAASECAGELRKKGGGPPENHLNEMFVIICAEFFKKYDLKISKSNKAFPGFVSQMYYLVYGKEKHLEQEIDYVVEATRLGKKLTSQNWIS